MIKEIGKVGLDKFRQLRSRLVYEMRSGMNSPTVDVDKQQNVLIITIDCLRNDRLSVSGYHRKTTPFLDSLNSYSPAIAAAPWTFSSVPSILTGLYPHNHGAAYPDDSSRNQDLSNPPNGIRDNVHTLADLLESVGYKTRFITAIGTAAIPIKGRFKSVKPRHDVDAGDILSDIQRWWNNTSGPKFGYVQLGDLHEPLHDPQIEYFDEIPNIDGIDRWRFGSPDEVQNDKFERYRSARGLLYDTLLRYVDEEIERVLDELAELKDTIVIVTSDHGEEFWEYKSFEEEHFEDSRGISGVGHGHALVPPVLEVPIITNLESISGSTTRRSSTDIVPTILSEMDATVNVEFDGEPLQEPSTGETALLSQEIAYGPNQISVTEGNEHLIYVPTTDRSVLIDFETGEQIDDPETKSRLMNYVPRERATGSSVELSDDVQKQLSDLGYAE
ncbi:hypothetical protein DEQ92_20655 [Haloferax sp. Atlit-6N]|uniref:sulfatase-like hydrolase/transferase n=1 Tax=Haloferax sp. Atlit-6N TaxID=2077205 RepID=UPI000E27AFB0|nr:sulfatase-like hydrolase/transferase [Haloferax sp. Atlit-6N]REA00151.1 hypothetical protein DEQ92_20655 [Haloferax sp. Atlit-6N]